MILPTIITTASVITSSRNIILFPCSPFVFNTSHENPGTASTAAAKISHPITIPGRPSHRFKINPKIQQPERINHTYPRFISSTPFSNNSPKQFCITSGQNDKHLIAPLSVLFFLLQLISSFHSQIICNYYSAFVPFTDKFFFIHSHIRIFILFFNFSVVFASIWLPIYIQKFFHFLFRL